MARGRYRSSAPKPFKPQGHITDHEKALMKSGLNALLQVRRKLAPFPQMTRTDVLSLYWAPEALKEFLDFEKAGTGWETVYEYVADVRLSRAAPGSTMPIIDLHDQDRMLVRFKHNNDLVPLEASPAYPRLRKWVEEAWIVESWNRAVLLAFDRLTEPKATTWQQVRNQWPDLLQALVAHWERTTYAQGQDHHRFCREASRLTPTQPRNVRLPAEARRIFDKIGTAFPAIFQQAKDLYPQRHERNRFGESWVT